MASRRRSRLLASLAVLGALGVLVPAALALRAVWRDPVGPPPPGGFEALRAAAAHETSAACRRCHPEHHASWSRTFHRTMTQVATPAAIVAPFDGRTLTHGGSEARPWQDGDRFFLRLPDPQTWRQEDFEIALAVGSRRMQQYVTRIGDRHVRLPFAWSLIEGRWFHLSEAFFDSDPGLHENTATWDFNCIFCHNVGPNPGLAADGRVASSVEEHGIACEACHGPGEEHSKRMASPLRRYAVTAGGHGDPTIVNPARLPADRSVQVCGHCHGQRLPADPDAVFDIYATGDPYTPGEDLARHWQPVFRDTEVDGLTFASRFWGDGSPRLTAYEYQGLLRSQCYTRGGMTCLDCHSMHAGDREGQLRTDRTPEAACATCHADVAADLAGHSHHDPLGRGASCLGCHAPEVVHGVLTWHPTHEIVSPDPARAGRLNMPDACTTCHSGQSRRWAATHVVEWWPGHPATVPGADDVTADAPVLARALFAGDAVFRALAARTLGLASPDPAVGELSVPLLAEALLDPYPAVRRHARLALAALTGRSDLPGPGASVDERVQARDALLAGHLPVQAPPAERAGWPYDAAGGLDRAVLARWNSERIEVPVSVGE